MGPWYTHLLSGEVWSKVAFVKDLQPKSHISDVETTKRLNYARKHRNWGAEKWQQVVWIISKHVKYLGVAEGSLFAEGLESGTRVCRQL